MGEYTEFPGYRARGSEIFRTDDNAPASLDRICLDCGEAFTVSEDERDRLARQGWVLPKRCRLCRALRRLSGDTGTGGE